MESYLRNVIEKIVNHQACPAKNLEEIRACVPEDIVMSAWSDVIMCLFMEKGDTAYAREGYHSAVNLVEKHLLRK